jgi:hypothetical protein
MKNLYATLFGLVCLGVLTGCATHDPRLTSGATQYLGSDGAIIEKMSAARNYADSISYWDGDGISGSPSIVINLTKQMATFYKDGQPVGVSAISSGRPGYETPTGRFKVTQKSRDHVSNLYGDYVDDAGNVVVAGVGIKRDPKPPGTHFRGAPMPYFMRIHGAVGLHAGYLPGVPDSSGCIRLPESMAERFFAHTPQGTPVTVTH